MAWCFQTKNPNLGKFWSSYGHLVYITAIWNILWPFGIFYGNLVYFPRFGILSQEKSGNLETTTQSLQKLHSKTSDIIFLARKWRKNGAKWRKNGAKMAKRHKVRLLLANTLPSLRRDSI
jgi:hypothetical protein